MEPLDFNNLVRRSSTWDDRRLNRSAIREEAAGEVGVLLAVTTGILMIVLLPSLGRGSAARGVLIVSALSVALTFVGIRFRRPLRRAQLSALGRLTRNEGVSETCPVEVRLVREGVELGRDTGLMWIEGPMLRYEGIHASWTVSIADLRSAEARPGNRPRLVVGIDARGIPLILDFEQLPCGDEDERMNRMFDEWRATSTWRPSPLLPPLMPQERTFGWYLRAAFRRTPMWLMPTMAVVMCTNLFRSGPLHTKLWWTAGVVLLQGLFLAYRATRRQDEADRARLLQGSFEVPLPRSDPAQTLETSSL